MMTSSTSDASTSACSRASRTACAARSVRDSSGLSRCRLLMPVRWLIHSSDVSTISSSSTFVTRVFGAAAPMPRRRARSAPR